MGNQLCGIPIWTNRLRLYTLFLSVPTLCNQILSLLAYLWLCLSGPKFCAISFYSVLFSRSKMTNQFILLLASSIVIRHSVSLLLHNGRYCFVSQSMRCGYSFILFTRDERMLLSLPRRKWRTTIVPPCHTQQSAGCLIPPRNSSAAWPYPPFRTRR